MSCLTEPVPFISNEADDLGDGVVDDVGGNLPLRLRQVLRLLMIDRDIDSIAAELEISKWTVRSYIKQIYRRFGVHGRDELLQLCTDERDVNRRLSLSQFAAVVRTLPPRMDQIFALLLAGRSEKQISARLGITVSTVHDCVKQLHVRFHARSRAELLSLVIAFSIGRSPESVCSSSVRVAELLGITML